MQARYTLSLLRDFELKKLRVGKCGRPYQPSKHFTRTRLSEMALHKLNITNKIINNTERFPYLPILFWEHIENILQKKFKT